MNIYRKTYEVVGYAYEADLHCLDCTCTRFGFPHTTDGNDLEAIDNEGNAITPYFLGDTTSEDYCGDCFTRLDA